MKKQTPTFPPSLLHMRMVGVSGYKALSSWPLSDSPNTAEDRAVSCTTQGYWTGARLCLA